jgi:hypothetical protein
MQGHHPEGWRSLGLAVITGLLLARPAAAQTPTTYQACYVPSVGALYLIGLPGLPTACLSASHVPISWTDGSNAVRTGTAAAGDLSGTYPNPNVARLQGTALASTVPTSGQVLGYNGTAWAPAANTISGAAGGDLGGTYPNPTVARLQGTAVASAAPTSGQVLSYNGTAWTPAVITPSGSAGGDLGGTYPNPTVARLQGTALASTAPGTGQGLLYNGTSWAPGVFAHGSLTGLANDDHSQYLLANGVRNVTNGFAVTGTVGSGTIAASGAGARFVWYPGKAALRAGSVSGVQWDDAYVGSYSIAAGTSTMASGYGATAFGILTNATGSSSTALGNSTTASGTFSSAMGNSTTASGNYSTAMGYSSTASGGYSIAIGIGVTASGTGSTAMGSNASTNGHAGAFVYADASNGAMVLDSADNQFVVRASGGFSFRTASDLSTGCNLPSGSGVWSCASSRRLKTDFAALDGETVLGRIRDLPVQLWTYRSEPGVRHFGAFAEDFHRAFGLGVDTTSIGMLDLGGVNLAAVKALEQRTRNLQEQLLAKDREIEGLNEQIATMRRRLERLEVAIP